MARLGIVLDLSKYKGRQHEAEIETDDVDEQVQAELEPSTELPEPQPEAEPTERKKIKATPYEWQDPWDIPLREWLYGNHMIRKFVTMTASPGGVGKSSLLLVEGISMATGRDLLDIGYEPERELRIWYWNGEDPLEETKRRIAAICKHYGITKKQIGGKLFIDSGRDTEIKIAVTQGSGFKIAVPVVNDLVETIVENKIDLVIIDPFVSSHSVSENDNPAIDAVAKTFGRIADHTNCGVELVHHMRKAAGPGHVNEVSDSRGASAVVDAARSARVVNVMSPQEADGYGIEEDDRELYLRVHNGKPNMARKSGRSNWYKLESVDLGNGKKTRPPDNVGVATKWEPPKPSDGVTIAHLKKIMSLLDESDHRENAQANDWAGKMVADVLGLDIAIPSVKAKVKNLLRIWIKSGQVVVVEKMSAKRELRTFIKPGRLITLGFAQP